VTLTHPEYLWLFAAVPLAGLFMLVGAVRRRRLLAAYPHLVSPRGRGFKAACFLSGLALIALAAAGPGFGVETVVAVPPPPLRLIVALDCSRSMLARDLTPNRLTAAKALILDVLSRLPHVEAGLVAFAGRAWLACPVTADRTALALFLDAATPKDAPLGGTSPGTALEAARLALAGATDGAVLLVSDGEATVAEAADARVGDAPLFTVAVGGATPAPVPDGSGGFLRLASGQPVLSGVDAAALAALAQKGGGASFRLAPTASSPAPDIAAALGALTPTRDGLTPVARPIDRSAIVLAAGLALLLLDLFLSPTNRTTALALLLALLLGYSPPAIAASSAADNVDKGLAAWGKGAPDEALACFLTARARATDEPTVLFDIGATYYRLGRFDMARESFDRAAREATGALRARALYNQGNAAYRLGDADAAIDLYEAALVVDPADADAKANLEWLRNRKKTQPPEEQNGETGNTRRPGQHPSGTEEGQAKGQEGQAPSPQGDDDGSGGERQGGETATATPSPDPTADPGQATAPVAAAEGQKVGEKKARTSGAATDAVLSRIPDLPGLPVPPAYGRPTVEKDW
jgi:Ca-activated chloride channel family protein